MYKFTESHEVHDDSQGLWGLGELGKGGQESFITGWDYSSLAYREAR